MTFTQKKRKMLALFANLNVIIASWFQNLRYCLLTYYFFANIRKQSANLRPFVLQKHLLWNIGPYLIKHDSHVKSVQIIKPRALNFSRKNILAELQHAYSNYVRGVTMSPAQGITFYRKKIRKNRLLQNRKV